jgi:hypothetical protein
MIEQLTALKKGELEIWEQALRESGICFRTNWYGGQFDQMMITLAR